MAQRRMFSKTITNSSSFITMPHSAIALYFQLGMNADDDGYCEHVMVMRINAFQPDDLGVLHAKGFVHVFDDKVLVIKDWKENNYIQRDRYTPSKYLQTHNIEDMYTKCIQSVDCADTQVRLGKVRLGKDSKENIVKKFVVPSVEDVRKYCEQRNNCIDPQLWHDHYQSKGWFIGKSKMKDWKAAVRTWEKRTDAFSKTNNQKKSVFQQNLEAIERGDY